MSIRELQNIGLKEINDLMHWVSTQEQMKTFLWLFRITEEK